MTAISDAIKYGALMGERIYLKTCVVDSVNESERTISCTPTDEGAPLIDVNLQSVTQSDSGLCIIPKVGSFVTVGFLDKHNAVVMLYSEIEKIILNANTTIEINGGNENLYTVISDLIKEVQKIIVVQGTSPDVAALTQINQRLNKILC